MTERVHHFGPDPSLVGGMESVLRLLCEERIGGDEVVAHATWTRSPIRMFVLFCRGLRAVWRLDASEIAHIHLSEGGSFVREGALVALASRRGLRVVATIHGAEFTAFSRRHSRLVAAVLRRATVITCLDTAVAEVVERLVPSVPVVLMPNPVMPDPGAPPADATDEVVLFAGEITTRKGIDILVRAWKDVRRRRPHARCIVVGPDRGYALPELEGFEVRPPVNGDEVRRLLRECRVVALPSRAEGMPMILSEALAAGRPFVGTPVGGIPELADAGGVLVPVGDHQALADELTHILESPRTARELGERGRAFCQSTRSPQVLDGRLRELYASAVAGHD